MNEKAEDFRPRLWQRVKDSNPHKQSQSLLCYLYTNPLFLSSGASLATDKNDYTILSPKVKHYFTLFEKYFSARRERVSPSGLTDCLLLGTLTEPLENGCHLGTDGRSLGIQNAPALAGDEAGTVGPGQGLHSIRADASLVSELGQVPCL